MLFRSGTLTVADDDGLVLDVDGTATTLTLAEVTRARTLVSL